MNKAFLKKLHKEKRKDLKESWLAFIKEVAPLIGLDALKAIEDKDIILKPIYDMSLKEKEKQIEQMNAYGSSLNEELGSNPELRKEWSDWMKMVDNETINLRKPDYSRHPKHFTSPPEDPTKAYEVSNAWTYSHDWQSWYRAKIRYFLAIAVKLWKEKQ